MPPKSALKDPLINDDEEVLQAVVLADSFNKRFKPLTRRKPRCLLPICNAPLLDWTFESLALAGVQEIFVICRSHSEQVEAAISESKWSKPGSGIKIVPVMTAKETFSPGDAMRDIYTRGLVTSDFVLVMGDLVSNVRIDEVVRVHKERRKTNKDAIMTMVVKESGPNHRTRSKAESSVFVLDSDTSECLHYEPVTGYPRTSAAHIPREIIASHPKIEIRNDLIDCQIDVCSVEVPSLFQDNFDYLDIRRDFVHGVLTSDLLMKNIHCYIAKEGYAARVQDTKSYDAISKDILSRWTFPMVPDNNHPSDQVYEYIRGNKYIPKDNSVVLARTCKIGNNTLIGPSSHIAEDAQVNASVIGRNCTIGPRSIISHAYLFDGAVVGADCIIERSILGAGVQVRERSRIQRGCLLGDDVIIGPNANLEPLERLSKKDTEESDSEGEGEEGSEDESEDDDDDSDEENLEEYQKSVVSILGAECNAFVWPKGEVQEDEDEDSPDNFRNTRFMRFGDEASELDESDAGSATSESDSDSDEDDSSHDTDSESTSTEISLMPDTPTIPGPSIDNIVEREFRAEVNQSLERAFAEGHSVDNAAVELKTLRMASNVPISRVRESVVAAIVERIKIVDGGGAGQRQEIASVVNRWGELINKIGGVDPVETISALQNHCVTSTRMPFFGQILAALYQTDIVEEEDIRAWHQLAASKGENCASEEEAEKMKKCWTVGAHMIRQFDEQDSDEDDEDEDEGESEDAETTGSEEGD